MLRAAGVVAGTSSVGAGRDGVRRRQAGGDEDGDERRQDTTSLATARRRHTQQLPHREINTRCAVLLYSCHAPRRRRRALSDTAIPPSVCPSLGYSTLAACSWPVTRYVRTADPSADGRRSASSRTAVGGGISSRRPRGDNLFCVL